MMVHVLGVDRRRQEGRGVARDGIDRSEQVDPVILGLLDRRRTRAPQAPAARQGSLLADPGFILESDVDLPSGVLLGRGLDQRGPVRPIVASGPDHSGGGGDGEPGKKSPADATSHTPPARYTGPRIPLGESAGGLWPAACRRRRGRSDPPGDVRGKTIVSRPATCWDNRAVVWDAALRAHDRGTHRPTVARTGAGGPESGRSPEHCGFPGPAPRLDNGLVVWHSVLGDCVLAVVPDLPDDGP